MHARKSRLTILLAVTALLMTFVITGAAADHSPTAPAAITCLNGTADVWTGDPDDVGDGQGITAPGVDADDLPDGRDFNWRLEADCTVQNADHPLGAMYRLEVQGTATGFCGRSVAHDGSGTLGGVAIFDVTWESVGTVLIVSAGHNAHNSDGSASQGVLTAEVQASGGEDCTTPDGAKEFIVNIVAEAA